MRLIRIRRRWAVGLLTAPAMVGVLAVAPGVVVAAAPTAAPAVAAAAQRTQLYPLPNGDHVEVSGTGSAAQPRFVPAPGHPGGYVSTRADGRLTVVPGSELRRLSSLSGYQVSGTAPLVPTAPGTAGTGGAHPMYAMALLDIKALDHEGRPAAAAEVIVTDVDDPTRANWDGVMADGDARIEVPDGNYSVAVAVFDTDAAGNATETDLLTATDVSVAAGGSTVALDGRKAQRVSFTTPKPSVQANLLVDWIRGTAADQSVSTIGVQGTTPLYVSPAAAAKHGVLTYRVYGRAVSPASAASPYSYVLAAPPSASIPGSETFAVPASGLTTLDSTQVTDLPGQQLALSDGWTLTGRAAAVPDYSTFDWVPGMSPGTLRIYVSALPGLAYLGYLLPLPNPGLDGELTREFQPKPGQHTALTWRGGLIVPAPATVDAPCFLCRQGDVVHGVGVMDTDASGDQGQWSDGPTTITQDGKRVYSGSTMGAEFDQKVAAGRHRFVYSVDSTHDTSMLTALSTRTRISWGFDSQTVTTSTVPASFGCTPCAPLPILYADAWFEADGHESVGPGAATFEFDLRHQPYAADPVTTGAAASVSYDNGSSWSPLKVTLSGGHHVTGTFAVPANLKPGYLTVRFSAEDADGATLDETVDHAALVNAPDGLVFTQAAAVPGGAPAGTTAVCPTARPGFARCLALRTPARRQPSAAAALPDGIARADLLSAYRLPTAGGAGRTVALVDAHDDPTAEQDLAVYRATYGLAPCTTANGCFRKVNQKGKASPLPAYDPDDDWSTEVSLDLQTVSAVCPGCRILLVEADDASVAALGTAVRTATGSGAVAVSNSWGSDESGQEAPYDAGFAHPGVAVTASSGDSGFLEGQWPASLSSVIAVGGTTLTRSASAARGWTESAWAGGGSAYTAKPSWQHDTHCTMRTATDVSAVADPATGLAVYVQGDWTTVGGTSASSPIIAAMIALAGNSAALPTAQYSYAHASRFFDVASGSNANWNCGGDYLCTAGPGYDAPTGLGTPNGLGGL